MADRKRRGMWIKNNGVEETQVEMASRQLVIQPGEEVIISPKEVRDPRLRRALQERSISIVRPATEEEEEGLRDRLEGNNA